MLLVNEVYTSYSAGCGKCLQGSLWLVKGRSNGMKAASQRSKGYVKVLCVMYGVLKTCDSL